MDFISKLRMNNLFTPENMNPLGPPTGMNNNPMELFNRIYPYIVQEKNRDFEHQKQLMNIQHPPQLQNIANSMNAPPEQHKPMNVVFKEPVSEYQKQSLALKREDIEGDRQVANRRIDVSQQKNISDEKNKQQRTDIYKFKAEHPNLELIREKGGTVKFLDPITRKVVDTGVDSGTLSDADEIELKGNQSIRQIDERGKVNTGLQELRGSQNLEAIGARIAGQKDVNAAKINLRQPLPNQVKVSENLKARELANTDPRLGKYVKVTSDGFTIDMPGSSGGPSEEEFNAIKNIIYGKDIELPKEKSPVKKETVKKPSDPLGLRK